MAGNYAKGTSVSVERSMNELRRMLRRYGADAFGHTEQAMPDGREVIQIAFRYSGWNVRFRLPMPSREPYRYTATGRERDNSAIEKDWERECRRMWRAMVLVVKAKLEGVESGILTFQEAFLGDFVTPGGVTVSEWLIPQIENARNIGVMPAFPGLPDHGPDHDGN